MTHFMGHSGRCPNRISASFGLSGRSRSRSGTIIDHMNAHRLRDIGLSDHAARGDRIHEARTTMAHAPF